MKTRAQEIGEEWLKDSSFEKWFPFTAQEMDALKKANQWTKVSDGLPLRMQTVVFARMTMWPKNENDPRSELEPAHSWHLGWFDGKQWYDTGAHKVIDRVTQWCALPTMQKE